MAIGFELPFLCIFDADRDCDAESVEANKRQNRDILHLCYPEAPPPETAYWPESESFNHRTIVWSSNIQESLASDYPGWFDACKAAATEFGWTYSRLKKNPSLMEAALRRVFATKVSLTRLEKLAANVLTFFEAK
jgi:hypothetical protein